MARLKFCIHANGGYDVVVVDCQQEEVELKEYVGFAMTPTELDAIAKKFVDQGAILEDFRSPKKRELARKATEAVESARTLALMAVIQGGVEPEAVEKAKRYAIECVRLATEESC